MATWIFLRGLTREAAHWSAFPDVFQNALSDARMVLLDLPGNGRFHTQPSPLSVHALAQSCREELARQGVQPPFHLLAMSLGAMVAIEWARAAPAEIAGCVLINTSVRPFSPFFHRLRPRNYLRLLELALLQPSTHAIERSVWRLTSNCPEIRADVLAGWIAAHVQRPVAPVNALRQLVAAARYRAPAASPVKNLLLLASQKDGLVNVRCSQALARAWSCPLALHPSAGHDLPLDDPAWVVGQVREWVKQWQLAP
jgi:pimeloyl-ACP methyl ester carboxylesterase